MNIYIGHPKSIDYLNGLYPAIKKTKFYKFHDVVLPHENSPESFDSKTFLKNSCSLVIADGSVHATGLGIELGWADIFEVPILCIYQKDHKPAGSYKVLTNQFIEYRNYDDLLIKLDEYYEKWIESIQNQKENGVINKEKNQVE